MGMPAALADRLRQRLKLAAASGLFCLPDLVPAL
jgi:hypothetical protein